MYRILIIDDDKQQYESIKATLLQTNTTISAETKEKILNHFLQITYFESPSEAEDYIDRVAGTNNMPHVVICDVNFQGFIEKKSDNGRTRGLDIVSKCVQKMPEVPVFIVTFYEVNEVFADMIRLIPPRHYARWLYAIPKEKIISSVWTKNFNELLQFLLTENIHDIVIPQVHRNAIYQYLDTRQGELDLNVPITYKERNWNLEILLLGSMSFSESDNARGWEYGLSESLENTLRTLVAIPNVELNLIFEQLKRNYEINRLHGEWLEEIHRDVEMAVRNFLQYDWNEEPNVGIETYFKIGQSLDMKRLPLENGNYNIENNKLQGRLVNWLKSRLFVLTVHKLIKENGDSLREKRNYADFQLKHIIDFTILAGLKKDIGSYMAQQEKRTKNAQIIQYFYTYLKLEGALAIRHENDESFFKDDINYANLLREEKEWLEQDLTHLL